MHKIAAIICGPTVARVSIAPPHARQETDVKSGKSFERSGYDEGNLEKFKESWGTNKLE